MNMKKTIAAIAAGAVAVSAMATTVSALEAKTLTYNLVKTIKGNTSEGKITANFDSLNITAGDTVEVIAIGSDNSWDSVSFEISGSYWDGDAGANKSFNRVYCTENEWEEGYSIEGSRLMAYGWDDINNVGARSVKIPVKAKSSGTEISLVTSTEANIKVVAKYKKLPAGVDSVGALSEKIKNSKMGLVLKVTNGEKSEAGKPTVKLQAQGVTDVKVPDNATTTTYTAAVTPAAAAAANLVKAAGSYAVLTGEYTGTADETYTAMTGGMWAKASDGALVAAIPGVTVTGAQAASAATFGTVSAVNTGTGKYQTWQVGAAPLGAVTATAAELKAAGLISDADAAAGKDIKVDVAADGTITIGGAAVPTAIATKITAGGTPDTAGYFTINVAAGAAATEADKVECTAATTGATTWTPELPADFQLTGAAVNGDKIIVTAGAAGTDVTTKYTSQLAGTASEVKGAGEKKYPYKSTLTNNVDVITNVYSTSDFDDQADGTKIAKLINADAIRAVINDAVVNYADVTFVFNTAAQRVKDDGTYTPNAWEGTDYTSFGRHFWDTDPGYDANTIYINNDWLGNNLFEGALIINKNITLSLGATDKFDWTATSLSFSWDAIQDSALTSNAFANYIHNMVLRTSATWYWDNFQVVLGETETEEVDSGAPVEADDTDLEEEEADDLGDVDAEEEEEEEEPEVEPVDEPEVAPVETVTNPGTGNASVALAVIPVALAAAAIVAKKRG